eukprot:13822-Eustigmatos_ZCMA.PRE.1
MLAQVAAESRSLRAQLEASTQEPSSRAIVPSVPPQHDVRTAIVPSASSSADAGQLTRAVERYLKDSSGSPSLRTFVS